MLLIISVGDICSYLKKCFYILFLQSCCHENHMSYLGLIKLILSSLIVNQGVSA